jgi:hypothetical protein
MKFTDFLMVGLIGFELELGDSGPMIVDGTDDVAK